MKEHTLLFLPKFEIKNTNNSFKKLLKIVSRRNGNKQKIMQINILTIYYALGAALQLESIHGIYAADHSEEIDDFQFDVDQEVDLVSLYPLL